MTGRADGPGMRPSEETIRCYRRRCGAAMVVLGALPIVLFAVNLLVQDPHGRDIYWSIPGLVCLATGEFVALGGVLLAKKRLYDGAVAILGSPSPSTAQAMPVILSSLISPLGAVIAGMGPIIVFVRRLF